MDPTGIIESLKGVLDGAVTAGFLPDDSDKFIKIEHPTQETDASLAVGNSILRVTFEAYLED